MIKKIGSFFTFSLVVFLLLTGCGASKEELEATELYNKEVSRIEQQLVERDTIVTSAEALIGTGKTALDSTLLPNLETSVSNAKAIVVEIPELPKKVEDINLVIEEMRMIDYSNDISALTDAYHNLDKSIKQNELVTVPQESFIIERLRSIASIVDILAVTEDNDPNGNLNKAGGYVASIYFSSELVDQSKVDGTSVIDKGTDSGGNIEVYSTVEDANRRNTYLAVFDGSIFASGSHRVVGTVVVRTSDLLKASEQKELEASIIEALTTLSK